MMMISKIFNQLKSWVHDFRIVCRSRFSRGRTRKLLTTNVSEGDKPQTSAVALTIGGVAAAVEKIPHSFEAQFLQIGNSLQAVYHDSMSLSEIAKNTVQHLGGTAEDSLLHQVGQLVWQSLANFKDCRDEVAVNLERVNRITEHLDRLYSMCGDIEKNAMFLRVVGLNIGIESTRSIESEDMFTVIAQDIRSLSDRIMTISNAIRKDSNIARKSQVEAHQKIKDGLDKLNRLSDQAELAVRNAVKEINILTEHSVEALETAGRHSIGISDRIAEIVVGIQFHDQMRQRVIHISRSLISSQSIDTDEPAPTSDGQQPLTKNPAQELEQITSEVDALFHKTIRDFSAIGEAVKHLVSSLSGMVAAEDRMLCASANSLPFESLQAALRRLQQLLGEGDNLAERSRNSAIMAFETASRLSLHVTGVQNINFETHLKALNAIIKSAHLNKEGRTLEVLAQEMKRVSDLSNIMVGDIEQVIQSVSVSADGLQHLNQRKSDTGFNDRLAMGIADISQAYARFVENSVIICEGAQKMRQAVANAQQQLDFLPALSAQLSQAANDLNVVCPFPLAVRDEPTLSPEKEQTGKKTQDDDLGENVELF